MTRPPLLLGDLGKPTRRCLPRNAAPTLRPSQPSLSNHHPQPTLTLTSPCLPLRALLSLSIPLFLLHSLSSHLFARHDIPPPAPTSWPADPALHLAAARLVRGHFWPCHARHLGDCHGLLVARCCSVSLSCHGSSADTAFGTRSRSLLNASLPADMILLIVTSLLFLSIFYYLPTHVSFLRRRAAYYLTGEETASILGPKGWQALKDGLGVSGAASATATRAAESVVKGEL